MATRTATATVSRDETLTGCPALTQTLGHADTWPETWHTAHAQGGDSALLAQAAHDLAVKKEAVT